MKKRHSAKRTGNRRNTGVRRRVRVNPIHNGEFRNEIIDWLREAYAMERGLEISLEKQASNKELPAELRDLAVRHLDETRRHAELVQSSLRSLGSDISGFKIGMGIAAQASKGMASAFARDERIKDLLDAYSMEHFEIGFYTAIGIAAKKAGLSQVVEACRRILPDEQRMAQALLAALPAEVSEYLSQTLTM